MSNWDKLLAQDPNLARSWSERNRVLVLKEGELELHLDYREWEGNFRYDIRMWAYIDGEMRPTRKGIVIFPHQIKEFARLLDELIVGGDPTNQPTEPTTNQPKGT